MKILLRLKGGPRTTLPADINIFSLPFCTPQTNSLKIRKIQWQMPILPIQQHVARVSYTYHALTSVNERSMLSLMVRVSASVAASRGSRCLGVVSASLHKLDRPVTNTVYLTAVLKL